MNLTDDMRLLSVAGTIHTLDGIIARLALDFPPRGRVRRLLPDGDVVIVNPAAEAEHAIDEAIALRREVYACLDLEGVDRSTSMASAEKAVDNIRNLTRTKVRAHAWYGGGWA